MLTDRGGYKLDKGLDLEPGVAQPVGLLDEPEHERVRKGYGDVDPFYVKESDFRCPESVQQVG